MANTAPLSLRPRPLLKCVDVKNLRNWVPERARRRIDLSVAWAIIRDHYCTALVSRGVCPIKCERCREELVDLFRLEEATKPAALLTWLAKDHSARLIEKLIKAQKEAEFPARESDLSPRELYAGLFSDPETDLEKLRRFYE